MNIYEEVACFYRNYRGEKQIIGKSVEGRNIFAFFVGKRVYPIGICQYAMHAREYITAKLAIEQIKRGITCGGVWFIPLLNPDGALLCEEGIGNIQGKRRKQMLVQTNGGFDFSLWKANADAVDLNVNFDARWGTGKCNVRLPASENYIGTSPFCGVEARVLRDFTLKVCPQFTVSYHTKGEEIYWRFHQPFLRCMRDRRLAEILAESTSYPLCEAPDSAGGYKDWCIEKLKIPAFTVEVGQEKLSHPLGVGALKNIIRHNLDSIRNLTKGF